MGVEAAIARHAYLLVQARAAEKGLMLESGSADVAYSTQRADEIAIRILECERESDYLAASEIEALARLEAERRRLALLRSVDLVVPADGMVWRLGVSDGERLSVGDMVAELVDCRSVFILAAIPQDRFSDVETGGAARVRLSGETQDRVGRVVSLTGESNLANDRNLAATPVVPRTATAMARIALEASSNSASDCLAGRTARVLLPASSGGSWLALFARHFL
jgi:multidrug resistance efflux pump